MLIGLDYLVTNYYYSKFSLFYISGPQCQPLFERDPLSERGHLHVLECQQQRHLHLPGRLHWPQLRNRPLRRPQLPPGVSVIKRFEACAVWRNRLERFTLENMSSPGPML